MNAKEKKYYLGLDIGTNSCGWAVTDEKYNLSRAKGKDLWGVRLFDEAESAEDRRLKRTNRRRLDRKKLQLMWLREIFKEEIEKVDKNFFDRLNYSSLWEEDKSYKNTNIKGKDSLFNCIINNKLYTDKNYFNDYKTIYHLRQELTKTPAKDIRLLYLALHNIIKHRGHFLYEGNFGDSENESNISDNENIIKIINKTIETVKDIFNENATSLNLTTINNEKLNQLINKIKENNGIKITKQELCTIFNAKTKQEKLIIESFVDGKINLKNLYDIDVKIDFNNDDYLVVLDELQSQLNNNEISVLENIKTIYSVLKLKKILGNFSYICESMVNLYNTHKKQLNYFKLFIKDYHASKYFKMFRYSQEDIKVVKALTKNKEELEARTKVISNYPLYVKGSIFANKKREINFNGNPTDRTRESFYKYVKTIIALPVEVKDYNIEEYEKRLNQINLWIDNEEFLLKQRTKANSVLPNSLYEKELKQILKVNKEKFTFLKNTDKYGSNENKIIQILKFRVPYFVGPIKKENDAEQLHGWAIKEKNLDYKPWTLSKIINYDKAEDEFIKRMLNKCTYLKKYDVLPKQSFLYSKYKTLNELNNIKFDGNDIPVKLKQKIFNDLFCKRKKVTIKVLKEYLISQNIYDQDSIKLLQISGIDKEFSNDMSSLSYFINSKNFGENFVTKNYLILENIISYATIISDKTRLKNRIEREFGNILNDSQIKEIKGLNFSGWGSLSKEFLLLPFFNIITGEKTCIINEMWNTNQNLQQIISNSNYTLQEELAKQQKQTIKELTYQCVEDLYCSPSVKRAVWQTIKIINEVKELMGNVPDKIFVEVTRHDEEKGDNGRKLSRKNNILSIYQSKDFKNAVNFMATDLTELLKELESKDNIEFRSEKLYLYFLQLGKCAYSGEKIDILDLYNDNLYDIDHIFPQSLIKDDSINNKVLVKKVYNEHKDNHYPIYSVFPDWVTKQKPFWTLLHNLNLMSDKKYDRLIRTKELSKEELGGFIERQLVETNQSAKAVIDLLKNIVTKPNDVIYSKSSFVSLFRNTFEIPKSRIINDYHHAKDAYLNIVVGNIINNRFTNNPRYYYKNNDKNNSETKTINIKKLFLHTIYSPSSNEVIWNGKTDALKIIKTCNKNDCLITRHNFSNNNGAFYDETVYKKAKNLVPQKGCLSNPLNNTSKYGGYNSLKNAYFVVIEATKNNKTIKTIESVPILLIRKYKNDESLNQKIIEYISKENNLTNVKIVKKLNFKSTLIINGGTYWLGGSGGGTSYVLHNGNQWNVDSKTTLYIKAIEKYIDMKKNKKIEQLTEIDNKVILSKKAKENNKEIYLSKEENINLYNKIITQLSKPFYAGLGLASLKDKLIELNENFINLSVLNQTEVLNNILKRVSTGAILADLSLLGDGKNIGAIKIGKNITDKCIYLVEASPTGILKRVTRL